MSELVGRLVRRAEILAELGARELSDEARKKTAWQIESAAVMLHAATDNIQAAAEITRLQKGLDTAREDALEEAAKVADEKAQHWDSPRGHEREALLDAADAIRNLKDKEVAG